MGTRVDAQHENVQKLGCEVTRAEKLKETLGRVNVELAESLGATEEKVKQQGTHLANAEHQNALQQALVLKREHDVEEARAELAAETAVKVHLDGAAESHAFEDP